MISRRRALALLAFAPAIARAQPAPGKHKIGILSAGQHPNISPNWRAFFPAMSRLGYEEGRNVTYEMRYAEGVNDRLPQFARELTASGVRIIVVTGSAEADAAFRATASVPIVTIHATDPVETGLAVSLARPGRNLTGLVATTAGFSAKALALLVEALPHVKQISVLGNPSHATFASHRKAADQVAEEKGITLLPTAAAHRPEELDAAFERIGRQKPQALFMLPDALFFVHRERVIAFTARAKLPAMYRFTEDVEAGGLMAFATSYRDLYARAPIFIDKILKGAKPGDIPIEQPTRFGLWINQKTARDLGIKFPSAILARAERVIE